MFPYEWQLDVSIYLVYRMATAASECAVLACASLSVCAAHGCSGSLCVNQFVLAGEGLAGHLGLGKQGGKEHRVKFGWKSFNICASWSKLDVHTARGCTRDCKTDRPHQSAREDVRFEVVKVGC